MSCWPPEASLLISDAGSQKPLSPPCTLRTPAELALLMPIPLLTLPTFAATDDEGEEDDNGDEQEESETAAAHADAGGEETDEA